METFHTLDRRRTFEEDSKMAFDRLSQLGPRFLGEKSSDLEGEIKSAEQVLPISDSYREMLLTFGGAVVFENGAKFALDEKSPLNDKDGYQSLEVLYGLGNGKNSIEQKAAQYAGELPASFVPIGESSGGNLICVAGDGAVYLWDHEGQRNEGTWRIAASIDEFVNRLEPDDSEIGSTEGIIESESFLDF
jgi:hypothetical protein